MLFRSNAGEEYVPAEAIYEALADKGVDVKRLVAEIYDSGLGEKVNIDKLNGGKGNDKKEETISAQSPSVLFDGIDLEQPTETINSLIARPEYAAVTSAQIQELKNNGEQNKNIVDLADKLNNLSKSQSYDQVLKDHVEWAFSDDAQEQEAFRSLWGTLIALDGGVSDEYLNGEIGRAHV